MILWTCRVEEHLKEAVDWCSKFGLEFDAVNDNLPENVEKYGNNPRKVYATCYIDDLAVDKRKYDLPFHADEKIDYSKFDKTSFLKICDFSDVHGIITDKHLDSNWIDFLNEHGVTYYECHNNHE